jgi:hypothetical protein
MNASLGPARKKSGDVVPDDVLRALDCLNSHARAKGCGVRFIYSAKLVASIALAAAGVSNVRALGVKTKCRSCLGSGWWHCRYRGRTNSACRICRQTGSVYLRFAEIATRSAVWHTPWERGGSDILCAALNATRVEYVPETRSIAIVRADGGSDEAKFTSAGDWQPNLGGQRLGGEDAAALLNAVDAWIWTVNLDGEFHWRVRIARDRMLQYALELGRTGSCCHYCGATNVTSGQAHRLSGSWLYWSTPVCERHEMMPLEHWDRAIPDHAITPAVEHWLNRRGCRRGKPFTGRIGSAIADTW